MDSPDVLRMIFEQFAGDYETLRAIGLTCHAWRSLSLPALLQVVDLSCHNDGRAPEHECCVMPVVRGDYGAKYGPKTLVPRQHAYLRLIVDRPELAKYVKKLTWTLVWENHYGELVADIDRQTWTVFSKMSNVTKLDLASLHEDCYDPYIHQNPSLIFPAVTDLRLMGWMHRGLVKAIVNSLDAKRLRRVNLDHLQDEGALADGRPLSFELNEEYAHNALNTGGQDAEPIDDELYQRQEKSEACIFPGPMWLASKLLAAKSLDSLAHLEVRIDHIDMQVDMRNYESVFRETANLIAQARRSLRSLVIASDVRYTLYPENWTNADCGTWKRQVQSTYRPWCISMAAKFLRRLMAVLNEHQYPLLETVRFEGFRILNNVQWAHPVDRHVITAALQSAREGRLPSASYTEMDSVDWRQTYSGLDCPVPDLEQLGTSIQNS